MKEILNRFKLLIIKLVSIKGMAAIIATILLFQGRLDEFWWAIFMVVLMGWRAFEKIFGKAQGK